MFSNNGLVSNTINTKKLHRKGRTFYFLHQRGGNESDITEELALGATEKRLGYEVPKEKVPHQEIESIILPAESKRSWNIFSKRKGSNNPQNQDNQYIANTSNNNENGSAHFNTEQNLQLAPGKPDNLHIPLESKKSLDQNMHSNSGSLLTNVNNVTNKDQNQTKRFLW